MKGERERGLSASQVRAMLFASTEIARSGAALMGSQASRPGTRAQLDELVYAGFLRVIRHTKRPLYLLTPAGQEFATYLDRLCETRAILQGETA